MRLTCPECDARYEIPDDAIPEGGRDVECSACGHAWRHGGADDPADRAPHAADEEDDAADDLDGAGDAPAHRTPVRDPGDLRVLREEAEREARLRRGEAPGDAVDDQAGHPEDRPQAPAAAVVPARRDPAARRGAPRSGRPARPPEHDAPPPPAPEPAFRRPRPPSLDEELDPERKGGGRGVLLALLTVAALLTAAYLLAPRIAEAIPAAGPVLADYVRAVDEIRIGAEGVLDRVLARINGPEG